MNSRPTLSNAVLSRRRMSTDLFYALCFYLCHIPTHNGGRCHYSCDSTTHVSFKIRGPSGDFLVSVARESLIPKLGFSISIRHLFTGHQSEFSPSCDSSEFNPDTGEWNISASGKDPLDVLRILERRLDAIQELAPRQLQPLPQ